MLSLDGYSMMNERSSRRSWKFLFSGTFTGSFTGTLGGSFVSPFVVTVIAIGVAGWGGSVHAETVGHPDAVQPDAVSTAGNVSVAASEPGTARLDVSRISTTQDASVQVAPTNNVNAQADNTKLNESDLKDADAMSAEPIQTSGPGIAPPNSLEPLVALARRAKERFENEITGYTCLLVKQETIDGKLEPAQYLRLKIRDRRLVGDQLQQPLSIYAKFLKPKEVAGREVLYVENELDGDMLVRRGGTRLPNLTLKLSPDGRLARRDTNYSIEQTGILPMLNQILTRMESQREGEQFQIRFFADAKVDGRPCQHVEIKQVKQFPDSDFHIAKVYIDEELKMPVYFASYAWPEEADQKPVLQEQYVITKIDLNAELSDLDFDRSNPNYLFKEESKDSE